MPMFKYTRPAKLPETAMRAASDADVDADAGADDDDDDVSHFLN